ncbi:major facilitator superfamily domain-containing protein [Chlamydoabsidia padenii]|nr:major facilitator superfamily domain-containing protein [Chlamydoabsidia padenii]
MEPITRQITSQSNKSIFVVALDQDGPMVSHTMETINHYDTSDEDDDDQKPPSEQRTISSGITMQQQDGKGTQTVPTSSSHPSPSTHKWKNLFRLKHRSDQPKPDPRNFSKMKKNMILMIVAVAGASSPLSSTIYYPVLVEMQKVFNTTDTTMNASVSIFTFFTAFFPLLWATAGDRIGRRKIYLISFLISVIGSLLCGVSVNITMFIVFRAFSAIGSSSVMSMGAGTLADIFEAHERGRAFALYTCGPLLGPALGPIIGGYLGQGLGFRSIFYFLAIFNLAVLLSIFFFLPETWRPPVTKSPVLGLDQEKAASQQQQKKKKKQSRLNPLKALDLLLNRNIALAVTFVGVLFFVLYIINTTFTRTYASQYGFDSGTVGLCYLPNAIGCMVGGIAGGRLSDVRYNKAVAKLDESTQQDGTKLQSYPEMRLGGILYYGSIVLNLVALTAYGWCIQENVHWAYGVVCQFFVGLALMVPNVTLSAYMVDCFRKRGASVTACNNFARYIMAGIGSLVSSDLQRAMGSGPLFTMLGGLLALFTINLIVVQKKANGWRLAKQEKQLEKELQTTT